MLNNAKIGGQIAVSLSQIPNPPYQGGEEGQQHTHTHAEIVTTTIATSTSTATTTTVNTRTYPVIVVGGCVMDYLSQSHQPMVLYTSNPGKGKYLPSIFI